jgi:hypothetical protein
LFCAIAGWIAAVATNSPNASAIVDLIEPVIEYLIVFLAIFLLLPDVPCYAGAHAAMNARACQRAQSRLSGLMPAHDSGIRVWIDARRVRPANDSPVTDAPTEVVAELRLPAASPG